MTHEEETAEERLKAVVYQFMMLYERWAEDRQKAAKQNDEMVQLAKYFSKEVDRFKGMESHVRSDLSKTIYAATSDAIQKMTQDITTEANAAIKATSSQLSNSVYEARTTLKLYEKELVQTQWKVIFISSFVTVCACVGLSWICLSMLQPSPLTSNEIRLMQAGQLVDTVWPKLTKTEKDHWRHIADEASHPNQSSNNDDNANSEN